MNRAIVASLLVCMLAVMATAGCLEDGGSGEAQATTMTWKEFNNDMTQNVNRSTMTVTMQLQSLDEGDTLVIKDQVADMDHRVARGRSLTAVNFSSYPQRPITVEGDITDEFAVGDNMKLTTDIINITFTTEQQGQTITYDLEWMKEGWDTANNTQKPFPQRCIAHARSDTLSFNEFWQDYRQGRDAENQTMTLLLQSYDEGDTVVITDELHNLTYNATQEVTVVQFSSYTRSYITVEGDITDAFQVGDRVTLTSDIINTSFTQPMQGQNYTVHYETFADGWDTENGTQAPFPQTALEHVSES